MCWECSDDDFYGCRMLALGQGRAWRRVGNDIVAFGDPLPEQDPGPAAAVDVPAPTAAAPGVAPPAIPTGSSRAQSRSASMRFNPADFPSPSAMDLDLDIFPDEPDSDPVEPPMSEEWKLVDEVVPQLLADARESRPSLKPSRLPSAPLRLLDLPRPYQSIVS